MNFENRLKVIAAHFFIISPDLTVRNVMLRFWNIVQIFRRINFGHQRLMLHRLLLNFFLHSNSIPSRRCPTYHHAKHP